MHVYPYRLNNQYDDNMPVYLAAKPYDGWRFSHWSSPQRLDNGNQEMIVHMTEDMALAAHFVRKFSVARFFPK